MEKGGGTSIGGERMGGGGKGGKKSVRRPAFGKVLSGSQAKRKREAESKKKRLPPQGLAWEGWKKKTLQLKICKGGSPRVGKEPVRLYEDREKRGMGKRGKKKNRKKKVFPGTLYQRETCPESKNIKKRKRGRKPTSGRKKTIREKMAKKKSIQCYCGTADGKGGKTWGLVKKGGKNMF